MKSFELLAILCIMSSFLDNVADCRRLPTREAQKDDEWRAATGEDDEDLSADEIMNRKFPTKTTDDDETTDERIAKAGTVKAAAISASQHGEVNFGMDMEMDPGEFAEEFGENGDGDKSARMASSNERLAGIGKLSEKKRWPKGIIPYVIEKGSFTAEDRNIIYAGMQMWMNVTCIRFVKRASAEAKSTGHDHYIWFGDGDGCFTPIGYINGKDHKVTLESSSSISTCMTPGIVAHELGHVIGLDHEQNRKDRDYFIKVQFENVQRSMRKQFTVANDQAKHILVMTVNQCIDIIEA